MRKLLLILALLMHLAVSAQQATPPLKKVAIISLVGDQLSVDNYRERVGTRIDTNAREVIALQGPVFDHTALVATAQAASKLMSRVSFLPLSVPKSGSLLDPNLLLQDKTKSFDGAALEALKKEGFDHLLAVTKHSARANMRFANGDTGSGNLQGLGFYVDNFVRTRHGNTGNYAQGFVAPYAYLKITLVNLGDGAVVGEEIVTVSRIRSATENKEGLGAWDAISPAEKVEMLNWLIRTGISESIPRLLAGK